MGRLKALRNIIESRLSKDFWSEKSYSYGDLNPDKTFYIIRRNSSIAGLFSYYTYVLGHIKYAIDREWIPVVDMQHYYNQYLDIKTIGVKNAWEYFFHQPCGDVINLSEVYKSKNVVLSANVILPEMPSVSMEYFNDLDKLNMWYSLSSKYIPCNNIIDKYVEEECSKLNIDFSKTVGLMLRGTDYVFLKPKAHPRQPSVKEAISQVERLLIEYQCNSVFLSTEDSEIFSEIVTYFGNNVKYCDVRRYQHNVKGYLSDVKLNRKDDAYQRGLDYIIPLCILSKCKYLFAGRTSGSVAIPLLGNKFQKRIFWDGGYY